MSDSHHSAHSDEHIKVARELLHAGAEGDEEARSEAGPYHEYDARKALSFGELVELWHHEHNVAMHKERLYVPSSLAILVGTILGWKDLSATVVALGAVGSVGLHWYLVLIMNDFAERQDRFFEHMQRYRSDILPVMFNQSTIRFHASAGAVGPRTVQRKLRGPFVGTLLAVWLSLIAIKLHLFQ